MKDTFLMRAFEKDPFGVVALGETSSAGWATSAVKGALTAWRVP
jgi:hypothetical protein